MSTAARPPDGHAPATAAGAVRQRNSAFVHAADGRARRRLDLSLALLSLAFAVCGLISGSDGWSLAALRDPSLHEVVWQIRAPRVVGAWLAGCLLALAGAIAQGLFRNPLADPYLLGTSAGAGLGVVLVLAAGSLGGGHGIALMGADLLGRLGLVGVAFGGALAGMTLTLLLARGAQRTTGLLLAGVVVGVVFGAIADMLTMLAPDALRGKQAFMLGTTGFLGWSSCAALAAGLALALPLAMRLSRALDALTLGEDTARSLGLALPRLRLGLVVLLALATGVAVAQTGLVAFVGLVAPHLVRHRVRATHGYLLLASSATGGALLLASDVIARSLLAPEELPVGVVTAVLGGSYLLWLMRQRSSG
ncbi:MAG TPA: iron ABC transporter permease [Burkholderiaceae bacterium]|nr:iron ABC transporter permease [Burkholderiaceae bacterium]